VVYNKRVGHPRRDNVTNVGRVALNTALTFRDLIIATLPYFFYIDLQFHRVILARYARFLSARTLNPLKRGGVENVTNVPETSGICVIRQHNRKLEMSRSMDGANTTQFGTVSTI
jgi:hypothetical protein